MTDDTSRHDDEVEFTPMPSEDADTPAEGEEEAFVVAERAEAEEAEAAADELFVETEDEFFDEEEAQAQAQEAMAEAQHAALRARATWSLVHAEHLVFLFANCLFFVGVLAAWSRPAPGQLGGDPSTYLHGLDTIRGALIFALALYGFWTIVFNVWFRQLKVWPFLINALFALWVGIPGFTSVIGKARWDQAQAYLDSLPSKTLLDKITIPLSAVPPGYWMLTVGGLIVLIVLLKGIISGASASKQTAGGGGGGRRRRR